MSNLDATRRSITATLSELQVARYRFIADHGIDPIEPEEIMELKDIVARIERRMLANMKETAA